MKRICIFGTGSALKDLLSILPRNVQVVALTDNNRALHGTQLEGFRVLAPDEATRLELDWIVIAARASDEIRDQLRRLGVPAERIVAYYPSYGAQLQSLANRDVSILNRELGLGLPACGITTMYLWPEHDPALRDGLADDFVRKHAFRLAAAQIRERGVEGSIGEVGVYRGELAALLNTLFPDRALHLFDTFEGFAKSDLSTERARGFSTAATGDFKDTSVDFVLSRMTAPSQVRIHRGYFPHTTAGITDRFALASLDVDLYEPTLAGARWFYERLTPGGYLFVHDYNNRRYLGVRQAIDEFVAATGAALMPLPDFAGSVVILKAAR